MRLRTAVCLAFASLTLLVGASRPLNPLVPRVPNESAATPPECLEGVVPAPPRIQVSEIPAPQPTPAQVAAVAPPSNGIRIQLRDAQEAVLRDDRRAFDAALARARRTLADYPPGGERTAAQNALRVYEDIAALWDAQFVSPFFGEESAAYRAASAHPGWQEAIRRQVLVDDRDRRFYPARESRQFLASVAADRLDRLGVRTPAVPAIATRIEEDDPTTALPPVRPRRRPGRVESHAPAETTPSTGTAATRRTTRATTSTTTTATGTRRTSTPTQRAAADTPPATRRAAAGDPAAVATPPRTTAPATPSRTTTPSTTPRTTTPAPATTPAPPPVDEAPLDPVPADTAPLPTDTATTSAPMTDTMDTVSATDTTGTTTTAAGTDTTATTATSPDAATPSRGRSLVVPLILILVGIGVLIVLFRASK